MSLQDVAAPFVKAFAQSANNPQAAQEVGDYQNQRQAQNKEQMQMQIAPLSQQLAADRLRLATYIDPTTMEPRDEHKKEYDATLDRMGDTIGQMRQLMGGGPSEPGGLKMAAASLLDKAHITHDLHGHLQQQGQDQQHQFQQQNRASAMASGNGVTNPYVQQTAELTQAGVSPQDAATALRAKLGVQPKDTTEQERFIANYKQSHPGADDEKALRAFTDATTKESAGAAKLAAPLETAGVLYGIRGSDGNEYLASQMDDPNTPADVKELYKTVKKAQADKQTEAQKKEQERDDHFNQVQARLARQFAASQADKGTWGQAEDKDGNTVLFNSKTGETKAAPAGLHKSGYYTKQVAPLEAANLNIDEYINNKVFDGAGDLALQHEYFTATQPASGFRMTKVQQDILAESQSWINSIKGKAYHAATGTWFSPDQRTQIANAAKQAIASKKATLAGNSGGPKTEQLRNTTGGAKPNGKSVSLAKARSLPQYQGKTDDEITAAAKALGYEVKP